MTKYSEMTKYNVLYRDSYWGSYTYPECKDDSKEVDIIIENRNKFAVEHKLKSFIYKKPVKLDNIIDATLKKKYPKFADHVETYRLTNNMVIVITSPYDGATQNEPLDFIENSGFTKTEPLYHNGATTYYKIYEKLNKGIYTDELDPIIRETKRLRCLKWNAENKDKRKQDQEWSYYINRVGQTLVNDYIIKYDDPKKYLREYCRLNPLPNL